MNKDVFKLFFENAPDAILVFDWSTEQLIHGNRALEVLLERPKEKLTGMRLPDLYAPEQAERLAGIFRENIDAFGFYNQEVEIEIKPGKVKTVHVRASKLFIEDTPVVQAVYRDITEQIAEYREKSLNDKFDGVLELAGSIINEMILPLQVIYGYSESFIKHVDPEDPNHKRITQILEQVDRLKNLTVQLQNISKYETKTYFGKKLFDINKASKGVIISDKS